MEDEQTEDTDDASAFDNADDDSTKSDSKMPDLIGQLSDFAPSRRDFLSNTAKVGAGAAALGITGSGTAAAAHADKPYSDSEYEDNNPNGYGALSDVQIIKFALLLERLEATFYTEAVGDEPIAEMGSAGSADGARLGESDVEGSDIAAQFANPSRRYSTFQRFKQIRDHEQAHVKALEGVLEAVGEDPSFASDVEFEFPYEDTVGFVAIAQALEDTGAGAYTAAAPAVDTEEYLAAAAQILAVENRHASYLAVLNSPLPAGSGARNPFPDAFQPQLSVTEVVSRAEPFVVGADADDIVGLLDMNTNMNAQTFSVTVENVSTPGLLSTDRAKGTVPLSPGAWGVFTGDNPAFNVGESANKGTMLIAEDGFPGGPLPPKSGGLADTLAEADNVSDSGTFASPGGPMNTPGLLVGESAEFTVTASPGEHLTLETMFVQSNDWFYGFEGLSLFDGDEPISGNVTDQLGLYDAGTEEDARPGHGPKEPPGPVQKPVQDPMATDVGTDEDVPIQLATERHPDFEIPDASEVIKITVTPQ